jgi:hypothetical protein
MDDDALDLLEREESLEEPASPARSWFQRLKDAGEVAIAAPFVILFGLVVIYLNTGAFLFVTPAEIWRMLPFSEESKNQDICEDVSPWLLRSDKRMQAMMETLERFDSGMLSRADMIAVRASFQATLDDERADPAPPEAQELQRIRSEFLATMVAAVDANLTYDRASLERMATDLDILEREEEVEYQRLRDLCG